MKDNKIIKQKKVQHILNDYETENIIFREFRKFDSIGWARHQSWWAIEKNKNYYIGKIAYDRGVWLFSMIHDKELDFATGLGWGYLEQIAEFLKCLNGATDGTS